MAARTKTQRPTLGELLQNLRKQMKRTKGKPWTQKDLAIAIDTDSTTVSKVENGARPPNGRWLDAALKALNAPYPEYQEAMEMAGFPPQLTLPDEDEIRWARAKVADIMKACPYPTYLADPAIRILDWNPLFERLDPEFPILLRLRPTSILEMLFGSEHPSHGAFLKLIDNPEEFFPQQTRILYHDWQQAQREGWYHELLPYLLRNASFRRYWEAAEQSVTSVLDVRRALYTLRLHIPFRLRFAPSPGAPPQMLSFHVQAEPFVEDRRFRFVVYQPSDIPTIRQCLTWNEEEGR